MEVLWSSSDASVAAVQEALASVKPLAFNSVQTTLRILETKGFVRHREDGRAFRYTPIVARAEASQSAVNALVQRFFGSPGALAVNLLENEHLSADELARIRALVTKGTKQ